MIIKIASPPLDFIYFGEVLLFLGRARNKLSFLNLPWKLNIMLSDIYHRWNSLVTVITCWYECFFFLSMYCGIKSVIQIVRFFMKWQNVLKLIVTSFVVNFSITISLCFLFFFLQIADLITKSHLLSCFQFLGDELPILLAATSWVCEGILELFI